MEQENEKLELVYGLEDKPSPLETAYAALQHLLAIIVGIITPTLIIGGVLGLGERIPYLISMSLIVSGVATFIQAKRIGPVGSGLLSNNHFPPAMSVIPTLTRLRPISITTVPVTTGVMICFKTCRKRLIIISMKAPTKQIPKIVASISSGPPP